MERNEAIAKIRSGLRMRSGKAWSVTSSTGTAHGWIRIQSVPSRRVQDCMTDADRFELNQLLGLEGPAMPSGVVVSPDPKSYAEYVSRAHGARESGR